MSKTVNQLPVLGTVDGTEQLVVLHGGTTSRVTLSALANSVTTGFVTTLSTLSQVVNVSGSNLAFFGGTPIPQRNRVIPWNWSYLPTNNFASATLAADLNTKVWPEIDAQLNAMAAKINEAIAVLEAYNLA